jgi:serine-type D-Ala-D-Ala carboxypeptidase/endopeptidase
MRRILALAILSAIAMTTAPASAQTAPSDDEIRRILVERIDTARQGVGIVVGVIDPDGRRRIVSHGALAKGDPRTLDANTVFEIGSITKVFTALLLADAVERKDVALTDPISKFLPATVKVPERAGRAITLQDLAMHLSGLPRLPLNFSPKDPFNPYADYTVDQLHQFISSYQLTRDIGSEYEYSNLGGGLLGHLLARRAGMDYEALVTARITGPLGMTSTGITLSPDMKARLATGHTAVMQPTANWDLPTLAGAGALRSTVNDMLIFLAAAMGQTKTPLSAAFAATTATRKPTGIGSTDIALGWHIARVNGTELVWHNGGTGGYRTFIGYDPKTRVGVVALSNASTPIGVDDIGNHLLDRRNPLAPQKPVVTRAEITVDPKIFDGYVGRYQLTPSILFTVTRDGDKLMVQLTGQQNFQVYPETTKNYFYKVVDAQLTFETDAQGKATALTLHQNGANQRAPRIEGEPVVPKEISLAPAVLDRYAGRYQLAPGVLLTFARQEARFFVQLTGQPQFEIFATSERDFFLKVVDAQLTFEVDGTGRATAVVLHQGGRDQRATRVE